MKEEHKPYTVELLKRELFTEEELNGENGKMNYSRLVTWFNIIAAEHADIVDQLTYNDFYNKANQQIPIDEWLTFMSDYRVSKLLNEIMIINARSSINRIVNSEEKSVAASQKLGVMVNFISKYFDSIVGRDSVVYIYTSVPLTEKEEQAKNAKTLLVKPKINPHNPANPGSKNNRYKGKV